MNFSLVVDQIRVLFALIALKMWKIGGKFWFFYSSVTGNYISVCHDRLQFGAYAFGLDLVDRIWQYLLTNPFKRISLYFLVLFSVTCCFCEFGVL